MPLIDAVLVEPSARGHVVVGKVEAPVPRGGEALVRVHATSINRGEIRYAAMGPAGRRIGWDFAGVVERAADDAPGPAVGTRVVGMLRTGAWAEVIAAPVESLAVLPDDLDFARAATLPVAGLTALYGLDKAHGLVGRNVLITGGTGGVGNFGLQLARLGGAHVVATVRKKEQTQLVLDAGAHVVVSSEDPTQIRGAGPYDHVLDGVGGPALSAALASLGKNGSAVLYGVTGGAEVPFDARTFYGTGGASIYGFILFHELGQAPAGLGLARLARLVHQGSLRAPIEVEGRLGDLGDLAQRLTDRAFTGKAVVHFT